MGMSYRLEHSLSPWVNFLIMPLFALANAGVEIPSLSYFNVFQFSQELGSVSMGIFLGLLIGKPLGISLASFIAVKLHAGEMPSKASWKMPGTLRVIAVRTIVVRAAASMPRRMGDTFPK